MTTDFRGADLTGLRGWDGLAWPLSLPGRVVGAAVACPGPSLSGEHPREDRLRAGDQALKSLLPPGEQRRAEAPAVQPEQAARRPTHCVLPCLSKPPRLPPSEVHSNPLPAVRCLCGPDIDVTDVVGAGGDTGTVDRHLHRGRSGP
jgi:hypothetical protein